MRCLERVLIRMRKIDNNLKKNVVLFSYDDPYRDMGGTSKTILGQIKTFNKKNIDCIVVSPYHISTKIWIKSFWTVRLNNTVYSVFDTKNLKRFLKGLDNLNKFGGVVVHHLKNINIDQLTEILDSCKKTIFFYIHDFYAIRPYENANVDSYALENIFAANQNFKSFFLKYIDKCKFIAPSEFCKEIWCRYFPEFKENVMVVRHQKFVDSYNQNLNPVENEKGLSVAFVGAQLEIKGWDDYRQLCSKFSSENRYHFFYLGSGSESMENVTKVKVSIQNKQFTMVDALRRNGIDVVCLLSKVPETYSYTFFEALSSNSFVVTFRDSGNIACQVQKWKNGCVLSNYGELISFFNDYSGLVQRIDSFRKSTKGGPLKLVDNDELVDYLHFDDVCIDNKTNSYLFNPLGFVLSVAYRLKGFLKHQK